MVIKMDSDVYGVQCKHNCPLHSIRLSVFKVLLGVLGNGEESILESQANFWCGIVMHQW